MRQRVLFSGLFESAPLAVAPSSEAELIEQVFSSPTVDRDAGVIKGVKILGRTSRNNREYTSRAMAESAALCEGVRVYIDHDRSGKERRVSDFFAEVKDVRTKEDGNYADLHYLKTHPLAESVLERSERFSGSFGMSPHQFGPTRNKGRKQIVESVARIRSVDIVDTPATTNSLFESEATIMTLRALIETIPEDTEHRDQLVALVEQEGLEELAVEMPAEGEEGVSSDDQMKAAFRAMVVAAFDDDSLDTKATIAKIKDILKSHEKLSATPEADAEAPEEDETTESLKAENERLKTENECRELLESAGVASGPVKLKALSSLTTEERAELIESWKVEPSKTNGKPKGSPPKREVVGSFPKTHEDFIGGLKRR